jgi:hypothetical protein
MIHIFPKYRGFFPHLLTSSLPPLSFLAPPNSRLAFGGWKIVDQVPIS